jgi:NSS family neurotransmitter:Na+ symporter
MAESDQFSGRLGLIFASIGAAIGTGNIWRFPRMVGANGGGTFLIPWLFFLFVWSIPLVIAEFAMGKRSRVGTVGWVFGLHGFLLQSDSIMRLLQDGV